MDGDGLRHAGGCACGLVRFEVAEPFEEALVCHCKRCQRRTGSAFSASASVPSEHFRLTDGEEHVQTWAPAGSAAKSFCGTCGSALYAEVAGRVWVRLGAVDGDPGIRPSLHQFLDFRALWCAPPDDGLPGYGGSRTTSTHE